MVVRERALNLLALPAPAPAPASPIAPPPFSPTFMTFRTLTVDSPLTDRRDMRLPVFLFDVWRLGGLYGIGRDGGGNSSLDICRFSPFCMCFE